MIHDRCGHTGRKRRERGDGIEIVPALGIVMCLMLMFSLPSENWLRLAVWLAIGFAIYFGYGYKHSALREANERAARGTTL